MITKVKKLPKGVKLSQYHREHAVDGYYAVQYYGHTFYIPASEDVEKTFDLAGKKWKAESEREHALMFIIGALYLQIRDNVLAEANEGIRREILGKMEEMMFSPIQRALEERATSIEKQILEQSNGR